LAAQSVAAAIARGVRTAAKDLELDAEVIEVPVADGGEGTIEAAVAAGFDVHVVAARDPLGDWGRGRIAINERRAVIELAELCGWARMPAGRTAPLDASSTGLGDGIRAALDLGCQESVLAVGGSVSTDGGTGMLVALGARLLDRDGAPLPPGGGALSELCTVDVSRLDPRLAGVEVVLASDVDNPLLGSRGTAAVFGPQKGATPDDVQQLEQGLARLANVIERTTGIGVGSRPGCGAAGGIGAAAVAYLGARIASGADLVLDLLGFDDLARTADLVVTGEGRWDAQTAAVKAPARVTARARAVGADVVVVAGLVDIPPTALRDLGVAATCALTELEPDSRRRMRDAAELVEQASAVVFKKWCDR
jgi:glycerate kinase